MGYCFLRLSLVRGFFNSDLDSNLLSYVWRDMKEGTEIEVADPNIVDSSSPTPTFQPDEVLSCLKIALLCVQEYAIDRPFIFSVALMLGNKTEEVPKAKAPGYCVRRFYDTSTSPSSSPLSSWRRTLTHSKSS